MKTDGKTLKEATRLMKELEKLQTVLAIMNNYDAKSYMTFFTQHNNNEPTSKEISIPMKPEMRKQAEADIKARIAEIKAKLEAL